jgi:hypothetical protein
MTEKSPGVGEAIRAGEAQPLDLELIEDALRAVQQNPPIRWGRGDVVALIRNIPALIAEVERLRESARYHYDQAVEARAEVGRLRASSGSPDCATCGHSLSTHDEGPSEDCCRFTFGWGDKCSCGWPVAASDATERDTPEEHSAFLAGVKMAVEKGLGFASARRVDRLLRIALASPRASAATEQQQWHRREKAYLAFVDAVRKPATGRETIDNITYALKDLSEALSSSSPVPTGGEGTIFTETAGTMESGKTSVRPSPAPTKEHAE